MISSWSSSLVLVLVFFFSSLSISITIFLDDVQDYGEESEGLDVVRAHVKA